MRTEESIVINRSPDDVFAFLAVRDNDPVWMSAVVASEWLDSSGIPRLGRRGRMAMKIFGRRVEYVDEVTTFETVVAETERMFGRLLDPLVARLMAPRISGRPRQSQGAPRSGCCRLTTRRGGRSPPPAEGRRRATWPGSRDRGVGVVVAAPRGGRNRSDDDRAT